MEGFIFLKIKKSRPHNCLFMVDQIAQIAHLLSAIQTTGQYNSRIRIAPTAKATLQFLPTLIDASRALAIDPL